MPAEYSVFYFLSTLSMIIYKRSRGNLQESESYTALNLIATGAAVLLVLYFVIWQSYLLRAIISSILICLYGLTGVVGLGTLARFTSAYS